MRNGQPKLCNCHAITAFALSRKRCPLRSFTTTPDNRQILRFRFGITIRPLNVSAMLHMSPKLMVAPTMATSAYTSINNLLSAGAKKKLNTTGTVKSPANNRRKCETAHRNCCKNRYPSTICRCKSADGKLRSCCISISDRNTADKITSAFSAMHRLYHKIRKIVLYL